MLGFKQPTNPCVLFRRFRRSGCLGIEIDLLPRMGWFFPAQIQDFRVLGVGFVELGHGPLRQAVSSTERGHLFLGFCFFRFGLFEPAKRARAVVRGLVGAPRFNNFGLDRIQKGRAKMEGVKVVIGFVLVGIDLGNGGCNGPGPSGVVGYAESRNLVSKTNEKLLHRITFDRIDGYRFRESEPRKNQTKRVRRKRRDGISHCLRSVL